jgi:uroporphyrinogen-III decarboxylase
LRALADAMNVYLRLQEDAGADVIQIFDSWAGLLDRSSFSEFAVPAAGHALAGLAIPRIYFAPGAGHTLDLQPAIEADAYSVDWRLPIDTAWEKLGDVAIQGNLDPAVLLAEPETIRRCVAEIRNRVAGRPGFVANLGHGIDRRTPPEHVAAFVDAVRS